MAHDDMQRSKAQGEQIQGEITRDRTDLKTAADERYFLSSPLKKMMPNCQKSADTNKINAGYHCLKTQRYNLQAFTPHLKHISSAKSSRCRHSSN